ncbi:MAG: hypothetical protein GYB67_08125 [Chloroflexi bacterium]|nr:hypothetical protein [Chloroflexota bacterium]
MTKRKRDMVSDEMRERLATNREGRLTTGQWLEITGEPIILLLLLSAPLLFVLGPRLAALVRFSLPLVLLLLLAILIVPILARARRYARTAVHFTRLQAGVRARPWWMFWQPDIFHTPADEPVRFSSWLAPRPPLAINREYLIYYLEEPSGRRVLLSLAPADHEEADRWQPTPQFNERYTRRTGRQRAR